MNEENTVLEVTTAPVQSDLSTLVITLLKGVIYREGNELLWSDLIGLQARVRDYVGVLGLDLTLDESEGHAFLKGRSEGPEEDVASKLPRLVARRPLSFPVSLLLALLRKRLAEFDASGGDTRMVLKRDEIVELVRVFLPDSSNEAKLIDQIDTHISKIVELGFLRRLKNLNAPLSYEVRRILKAFVDAQWLAEFDTRLAQYQAMFTGEAAGELEADKD
ncbi:MAG: hypothetical protein JWR17_4285 [Pseudomonas sp.]|jgi:hypothetical protein|uniref:DUF4194 domain-containing protein n=1 Tax=Pseudomonas sp. TaxID=306 RepID=UPI00260F048D|nr:DUF4194 domain-containing protein [Pseudomonas sp.]MDB6051539.1 hypothetical protein [Pseudomonas sp.]